MHPPIIVGTSRNAPTGVTLAPFASRIVVRVGLSYSNPKFCTVTSIIIFTPDPPSIDTFLNT